MEDQKKESQANAEEQPQPDPVSLDTLLERSQLQRSVLQKLLDRIPVSTDARNKISNSSSENQ